MATLVCYGGTYIHTESCIDYYNHHGDMRFTQFLVPLYYTCQPECVVMIYYIYTTVLHIHFLVTN